MGLAVAFAASLACVGPSTSAQLSTTQVAATAAVAELRLRQFQTNHQFLAFVASGHRLYFSGGDRARPESSPDIYAYDWTTNTETLVARAKDSSASILTLAVAGPWIAFTETYEHGPTVYRVRLVGPGVDRVLDELPGTDDAAGIEFRHRIPVPMVSVTEQFVAWTAATDPTALVLRVQATATGAMVVDQHASGWIGYPRLDGNTLLFSQGTSSRSVWRADLSTRGDPTRLLSDDDVSEAAVAGDWIAMKKGGRDALDPAGIQVCHRNGTTCRLVAPASALAWEPSVGARYVIWQGQADAVYAYDLLAQQAITLAEAPRNAARQLGIFGRQAVFGSAVVWLSLPPGDLTQTANIPPTFNVLAPP